MSEVPKRKSITDLTEDEARDLAFHFSNALNIAVYEEVELFENDLNITEPIDSQRYPFHTDFVGTFKKRASEFFTDDEVEILLRMRIERNRSLTDGLSSAFKGIVKCLDPDQPEWDYDFASILLEDMNALIVELHRQREMHEQQQFNQEFKELGEEVLELKEIVKELQAQVKELLA